MEKRMKIRKRKRILTNHHLEHIDSAIHKMSIFNKNWPSLFYHSIMLLYFSNSFSRRGKN